MERNLTIVKYVDKNLLLGKVLRGTRGPILERNLTVVRSVGNHLLRKMNYLNMRSLTLERNLTVVRSEGNFFSRKDYAKIHLPVHSKDFFCDM